MPDSELNIIMRARDLASDVMQKASGSLNSFAKTATIAGGALTAGLTLPLVALGKSALDTAMDYQSSMNMLKAVTGVTSDQMATMGQLAKELGADMTLPATSAGDAAKAMTELAKAGLSVNDVMGAAKGTLQLAAAASVDEARAAEIAANALNAFGLKGEEATRIADLLAAASNASSAEIGDIADSMQMASAVFAAAGVPIEDVTAAIGELANKGIKGSDAGTSLKQMLLSLQSPSKEAAGMLKQFGISVYDSTGTMRPFKEIIEQFSRAMEIGTETISTGVVKTEAIGKEFKNAAKEAEAAQKQIEGLSSKVGPLTEKIAIQGREVQRSTLDYNALVKTYGASSKQAQNAAIALDKLKLSMSGNQNTLAKYNADIAKHQGAMATATSNIGLYQEAGEMAVTTVTKMTQAERDNALATIFGSDAVRAANIVLAGGAEAFDQMKEAVTKEGAAADLAGARMQGLQGAIEGFKSQVETALLNAAEPFLGTLEGIARSAAELVGRLGTLDPAITMAVVGFAAVAAAIGPVLLIVGSLAGALSALAAVFGVTAGAVLIAGGAIVLAIGAIAAIGASGGGISKATEALSWLGATAQGLWRVLQGGAASKGLIEGIESVFGTESVGPVLDFLRGLKDVGGFVASTLVPAIGSLGTVLQGGAGSKELLKLVEGVFGEGSVGRVLGFVRALGEFGKSGMSAISTAAGAIKDALGPVVDTILPSLASIWKTLSEQFDASTPLMKALMPYLEAFGMVLGGLIIGAIGLVLSALSGLVGFIAGALPGAIQMVTGILEVAGGVFQTVSSFITGIVKSVSALLRGDWDGAMAASQEAVKGMAEGVKKILSGLWNTAEGLIKGLIGGVKGLLGGFVGAFVGFFQTIYDKLIGHSILIDLRDGIKGVVDDIVGFFSGLPGRLGSLISGIAAKALEIGGSIKDGIINGIQGTVGVIGNLRDQLEGALKSLINTAIDAINEAIPDDIGFDLFGNWLGIDFPDNPIPRLARGARNFRGGLALVGERGPELVALPAGSDVYSARDTRQMAGSSVVNNYYFNQTVNTNTDVSTVVQDFAMMRALVGA